MGMGMEEGMLDETKNGGLFLFLGSGYGLDEFRVRALFNGSMSVYEFTFCVGDSQLG